MIDNQAYRERVSLLSRMKIDVPTSSFDILDRICALVEEEPRRMVMGTWGSTYRDKDLPDFVPPCGTTACVAGWGSVVIGGGLDLAGGEMSWLLAGANLDRSGTEAYFESRHRQVRSELYTDIFIGALTSDGAQGSPEHAARVVRWLRAFMARHEAHLKTVIIAPGGTITSTPPMLPDRLMGMDFSYIMYHAERVDGE